MATKTLKTIGYVKGAGQRSKKRSGVVAQTVRILAADNKLLHQAAKAAGHSFNGWAVLVLNRAAAKVLKPKTEKTIA